jgi:hypothetical protein
MFKLQRFNEPLGTRDAPQYESSYSEGLIPVINGECEVRLPETRDRLIMIGYTDVEAASALAESAPKAPKPKPKKKRGR